MYKLLIILLISILILSGCSPNTEDNQSTNSEIKLEDNEVIVVDACDTKGTRKANVKVDIGFDSEKIEREYYAYTNEYEQVVYVEAKELILQDDDEPMKGDDRYCSDEAKVKGTEDDNLDEGHIIADSLGGVSNAYNITPQDSALNRSGEQADMEEEIRTALEDGQSVTNFEAIITYPNTKTQTPSSYEYSFEIDGKEKHYSFENSTR